MSLTMLARMLVLILLLDVLVQTYLCGQRDSGAGVEQLYQVKRMIGGIGNILKLKIDKIQGVLW